MEQPDFFQLLVDVIDEFRKRVDYDDFVDHEPVSEGKQIDGYDSEDPIYDEGKFESNAFKSERFWKY